MIIIINNKQQAPNTLSVCIRCSFGCGFDHLTSADINQRDTCETENEKSAKTGDLCWNVAVSDLTAAPSAACSQHLTSEHLFSATKSVHLTAIRIFLWACHANLFFENFI